jgi:uncharacterized protein (TIGR03083 family)
VTTTSHAAAGPRTGVLDRTVAMRLAATEYRRYGELLATLGATEWSQPTDCPAWDVRAIAAHCLGMAEMAASVFEQRRQTKSAGRIAGETGVLFIDALTDLQVRKHAGLGAGELVEKYRAVGPRAARARRRTPGFVRRRLMPVPQELNGVDESWTVGYLVDIVLTRDVWMHRVDTCRATGRDMELTSDHDGVLVADAVREWAQRHGAPYTLHLTGPAGGQWSQGTDGDRYELDAVEFCRIVSGRATGDGLLTTEVPF